jgi:hypothetical protein
MSNPSFSIEPETHKRVDLLVTLASGIKYKRTIYGLSLETARTQAGLQEIEDYLNIGEGDDFQIVGVPKTPNIGMTPRVTLPNWKIPVEFQIQQVTMGER